MIHFFKEKKIPISQQTINLLAERCRGNRQNLNNELKKVENFAMSKKKISTEDILKLSNLAENYNASELTDNCLAKNIKKILNSQFTRLPFYDKNSDKILGIINVKDVLKNINKKKKLDLKLIAKNVWFIPETTSVLDQLQEFKKKQRHLAFVIDEYGALMGIVTLEDIIEEIVGDIEDEHDIKIKGAKKSKDGKCGTPDRNHRAQLCSQPQLRKNLRKGRTCR